MLRLPRGSYILFLFLWNVSYGYKTLFPRTKRFRLGMSSTEWITAMGEGIELKGVSLTSFGDSLRGMKANENIKCVDSIVVVPAQYALEVTNNRPPTPFPQFVPQELWENSLWYHRLAFKLLYEDKFEAKKNPESNKLPWLKELPRSFSTPLHWSAKQVEQCQYDSLKAKVTDQNKEWGEFYNNWQGQISEPWNAVTFSDFVWALECANSRAFSGIYEGSSADERRSLLLFTGALTLVWPIAGLGTWDEAISGAIIVALSILARDVIFAKAASFKRYVICPVVDMFNHKSNSISDVSYNYFSNQFELRTDNYQAGEQVFISYGKQSNDRLLQYYGFVENDNPYDQYDFGLGPLQLLLQHADDMSAEVPIPDGPSPAERLKAISAAMAGTKLEDATVPGRMKSKTAAIEVNTRLFRRVLTAGLADNGGVGDEVNALLKNDDKASSVRKASSIIDLFDDVTVRALRALYSSSEEWPTLFPGGTEPSLNNLGMPLSPSTEQRLATALRTLACIEIASKPTTLDEDMTILSSRDSAKKGNKDLSDLSGLFSNEFYTALLFRIEKKKLLNEAINI